MKISKRISLYIIVLIIIAYIFFIGYKVTVFNKDATFDENKYIDLELLGIPKEVTSSLPDNLIEYLRNNDSIIEFVEYDMEINKDNEYLGTLLFRFIPGHFPYTEGDYNDVVITFFKRDIPKIPFTSDKLKYRYNGEYSLENSFLFIDGVSYSGKVVDIKDIVSRYDIKLPDLVVYDGFLITRFNDRDWQDIGRDIDYMIMYNSDKSLMSGIE